MNHMANRRNHKENRHSGCRKYDRTNVRTWSKIVNQTVPALFQYVVSKNILDLSIETILNSSTSQNGRVGQGVGGNKANAGPYSLISKKHAIKMLAFEHPQWSQRFFFIFLIFAKRRTQIAKRRQITHFRFLFQPNSFQNESLCQIFNINKCV